MASTKFTVKGIRASDLADRSAARIGAIAGWVATRTGGSFSPVVTARQAWVGMDATLRFAWGITGTTVNLATSGASEYWRMKEVGTLTQAVTEASRNTKSIAAPTPQRRNPVFDLSPGGQIGYQPGDTRWLDLYDFGDRTEAIRTDVLGMRGPGASGSHGGRHSGPGGSGWAGDTSITTDDVLAIVRMNHFPNGIVTYEQKAGWLRALQHQFPQGSGIWHAYDQAQVLLREQYFPHGPV